MGRHAITISGHEPLTFKGTPQISRTAHMAFLDRIGEDVEARGALGRLLPKDRLHCIENLVASGFITPAEARSALERYPMLREEMSVVAWEVHGAVKDFLQVKDIVTDFSFDEDRHYWWIEDKPHYERIGVGTNGTKGHRAFTTVPAHGRLVFPLQIAYACGKELAREWLSRSRKLAKTHAPWPDQDDYAHYGEPQGRYNIGRKMDLHNAYLDDFRLHKSEEVNRGFPLFLAFWYAQHRDNALGTSLYTPYLLRIANRDEGGFIGLAMYSLIHKDGGLRQLKRAMRAGDNDELHEIVLGIEEKYVRALGGPTLSREPSARS